MPRHVAPALLLLVLSVAPLAGCGKGARTGQVGHGLLAPGARLNAAGETPEWSALVRPGRLSLAIGDAAPVQVQPTVADDGKGGASWSGTLPGKGGAVSLSVSPKPCHDGVTGLAYPLTAVAAIGGRHYAGCAAPPGQGLGPRT